MQLNKILLVYTIIRNQTQRKTLTLVKNTLKKKKIDFKVILREKLKKSHFKNINLVLVLGGDGTFLMASHFIFDKTLIMGVNSDPKCREGFFMVSSKDDFVKKLDKVIKNKFKTRKLQRLQAYIGNKKIPELALNEFYVAAERAYHTARYYLTIRGKRERQKSSGVLVSTAAGSYAWIKSAGGKSLPLESNKFEYLIREPYCGRTAAKCSLANGILNSKERLVIEFEIGRGVIIADSTGKEYKTQKKMMFKISDKPLHSIYF